MTGNKLKGNQADLQGNRTKHLSILDINPAGEIRSSHYPILSYPPSRRIYASLPAEKYKNIITYYHQISVPENNVIRTIYPTGNAGIVFLCDRDKANAFFVGMPTHPREAEYTVSGGDYFVVLFQAGMSYAFYPVPQMEFADKYLPLNEILPGKSESLMEKMTLAKTYQERVLVFEDFLAGYLPLLVEIPDKLKYIISGIYQNIDNTENEKSNYRIYSDRHVRRLFQNFIGISPKLFSSIIRHQKILKILNANPYGDMAGLAIEQGYYDQSHFIKEFRKFHACTPSGFINEFIRKDK